jgi:acyl carrier protein
VIEPRFLDLVSEHLRYLDPDARLRPDMDLRALGLDSMRAVNLLLDIEDEYGVALPDSALTAATFASADGLWAAVVQAGGGTRSGHG